MKLLVEILIAIILHPIAVILVWLDLLSRSNMSGGKKLLWAVVALVWWVFNR